MSENVKYRMLTTPAEAMAAEGQYVERRCKDIGAWEYVTPGRSLLFYEGMFRLGWQFRARVVEDESTPSLTDAERVLMEYVRICVDEHPDHAGKEARIDAMGRALAACGMVASEELRNWQDLLDAAEERIRELDARRLTPPQPSPVQGDGVAERVLDALDDACVAFNRAKGGDSDSPRVSWVGYSREERIATVRAALAAAQPGGGDLLPLQRFADSVLDEWWERSFDGGDIQEIGVACGLLVEVTRAEPCDENCACADAGADFPTTCLVRAPALQRAILAVHRADAAAPKQSQEGG